MVLRLLNTKYLHEIQDIYEDDNAEKLYILLLNFMDLLESDINLGTELLHSPETALTKIKNDVITIQGDMKTVGCVKKNISIRVRELPTINANNANSYPNSKCVGYFIQLKGLVMKTYESKYLEFKRTFKCYKCKTLITIQSDYDKYYMIVLPKKCTAEKCKSSTFECIDQYNPTNCQKVQEIKIQENCNLEGGIPSTLSVTLEDDLVDCCKPGDNIIITGILKRRWQRTQNNKKYVPNHALKANYVEVMNQNSFTFINDKWKQCFQEFWKNFKDNKIEGRDIIVQSIAPELYGMDIVKLAVALILAGGCRNTEEYSHSVRSESHLLLIGDPGMGKSQILRFASKVISHSVITSGMGSTTAGLTVTAIKEDGEWQLKAGALVMADGGVCCIDEFNLMKEYDRVSLHEAMEQQTISVAKANIVCKLNTRCSIIAAANNSKSASMNFHSPLMSRFDLILPIKDKFDVKADSDIADYALADKNLFDSFRDAGNEETERWSIEKLKMYFAIIRKLKPIMSNEAKNLLTDYYKKQRQVSNGCKGRNTVRMLESLIRLSQAHAKLMYKTTIDEVDAQIVIDLMELNMFS